jgi:hypothetical protein
LLHPEQLGGPRAACSQDTRPVGLVDHQPCPVTFAQLHDVHERRDVSLHREHSVHHHQHAATVVLGALQRTLELVHAVVPEWAQLRLREQRSVEDRRVVGRVNDNCVLRAQYRPQSADVRLMAGREHERVVASHPLGELALELEVKRGGPVEQPRPGQAGAVAGERVARSLYHALVAGQAEVVVGGEHDPRGALHLHDRHRGRLDRAEVGHQVGLARGPQELLALVTANLGEDVCRCGHSARTSIEVGIGSLL